MTYEKRSTHCPSPKGCVTKIPGSRQGKRNGAKLYTPRIKKKRGIFLGNHSNSKYSRKILRMFWRKKGVGWLLKAKSANV